MFCYSFHFKSNFVSFIFVGYSPHSCVVTSCFQLHMLMCFTLTISQSVLPCPLTHLGSVSVILYYISQFVLFCSWCFPFLASLSAACSCLCACQHHQLTDSSTREPLIVIKLSTLHELTFKYLLLGPTDVSCYYSNTCLMLSLLVYC